MTLDPRTPILVGVGIALGSDEPAVLMARALEAAADDAGSRALFAAIDRIAVPKGTWSYPDPARLVAQAVGAGHARTVLGEIGVTQQSLVNQALRDIEKGLVDISVVLGGEARAWQRTEGATETPQPTTRPDEIETREPEFIADAELAAGIVIPPYQQYAVIENALGHHEGRLPPQDAADIANLWARFNAVAHGNPHAAFPEVKTASDLMTPGPGNRPLAFPYNRWHASQWTVDQAAALILCSAEAARNYGIPIDRWVFPLVAVDANHAVSLSRRRHIHRWPAMGVLGKAAAKRIGRPLADVEITEVYSCFPSAVRVQMRELTLPFDGTPTVTGGMAFAGGPFNNFVYQSTAEVIPLLRDDPAALGMVTTVCGLLTKPGLAVWTCTPDGVPALLDDFAAEAQEATPTVPVLDAHSGPATVVSFTVTYDGTRPTRTVVVADAAAEGKAAPAPRVLGVSADPAVARDALDHGMIGRTVQIEGMAIVS